MVSEESVISLSKYVSYLVKIRLQNVDTTFLNRSNALLKIYILEVLVALSMKL